MLSYQVIAGVPEDPIAEGVARELMRLQHARCREAGYTRIRTHTTYQHRPMLLLNIRSGFDVIGTTHSPGRGMKIVLELKLPHPQHDTI